MKSHEFDENEKIDGIWKQNKILLDHLLDISNGKWSTVGHNGNNMPSTLKKAQKSLNFVARKNEL